VYLKSGGRPNCKVTKYKVRILLIGALLHSSRLQVHPLPRLLHIIPRGLTSQTTVISKSMANRSSVPRCRKRPDITRYIPMPSLSKHVNINLFLPPPPPPPSPPIFLGACLTSLQGTLHQKTNDVSNSVARFRRNIKTRLSVRGEKARQPLCMGSAYASQITCVDDVVHAGRSTCSWRAGGYSCQPSIRMDGAAHMRQGRGKNLTSTTETYEAHCDLLTEETLSWM